MREAYQAMLPHATDWHRGRIVAAGHLRSVGGIRPAQTEMDSARVKPRERVHTARQFISKAETCKQSLSVASAVLVQSTYVWDILAVVVVRRILTAHCSHLRSRVSVGLEARKGNQRRQQS